MTQRRVTRQRLCGASYEVSVQPTLCDWGRMIKRPVTRRLAHYIGWIRLADCDLPPTWLPVESPWRVQQSSAVPAQWVRLTSPANRPPVLQS